MRRRSRGFTLIEVLVAMVILAGAVLVLANSWSGNFMRVRNARVNNTMASLLERKMTEMEVKFADKPLEQIEEEGNGDFGAKYPGYRWEMKSQKFEMPDMSSALTSREGGVDPMTLMVMKTTQDYIKETVKELSVSVFYKGRQGKEIKAVATRYFVDYSKDLPMPAGIPGMPAGNPAGGAPTAPPRGP